MVLQLMFWFKYRWYFSFKEPLVWSIVNLIWLDTCTGFGSVSSQSSNENSHCLRKAWPIWSSKRPHYPLFVSSSRSFSLSALALSLRLMALNERPPSCGLNGNFYTNNDGTLWLRLMERPIPTILARSLVFPHG